MHMRINPNLKNVGMYQQIGCTRLKIPMFQWLLLIYIKSYPKEVVHHME